MQNSSNLSEKFKSSQLCRGYGLGVTCIGCCHTTGCSDIYQLVEPPIYIGIKDCDYARNQDGGFLKEVWIGHPAPPFVGSFDSYMNGSVRVEGNFDQSWEKLKSVACVNALSFQTKLESKVSMEKISEGGNMIGNVSGNIGCLLYSHENSDKGCFFRPEICRSFLCQLINMGEYEKNMDNSMKRFINENIGKKKFNTLSLSRVIHLLGYHPRVVRALGANLIWRDSVNFDNSPDGNLLELNKLLEMVSR